MVKRIGIVDTTFSRVDMASAAIDEIRTHSTPSAIKIIRATVPGFKDLGVACKKLIEEEGADVCLALGWVGGKPVDEVCATHASIGIQLAQIATSTHILEVFIHESESKSPKKLKEIALDRSRKHALNALALLHGRDALTPYAGKGRRQGYENAGPL